MFYNSLPIVSNGRKIVKLYEILHRTKKKNITFQTWVPSLEAQPERFNYKIGINSKILRKIYT